MRLPQLLRRLVLALLVLVASAGPAAASSLEPSRGPGGSGLVRASDASSIAPFELPADGARTPPLRVVVVPALPAPLTSAPEPALITAPEDARARALRRMPQRRIRRHAPRAPDDF